ncbi:MAG: urea carboxylase-associated family protein [Pseudomonadota bacterium]
MSAKRTTIAPQSAASVEIGRGQIFRIVNTEGGQVVDTWMFALTDSAEWLSMAHSRTATYRLFFKPGDTLVSNLFNPMTTIVADTSPGLHDTLHAACSEGSNAFFGQATEHPNCRNNLLTEMARRGEVMPNPPDPWNLFEETDVAVDGTLEDKPAGAKSGDFIELRAECDLLLVCSACPSVVGNISGGQPRGAAIDLFF